MFEAEEPMQADPLAGRIEIVVLKRNAKGELCKRGFIEAKRNGSLVTRFKGPVEQVKKELVAVHKVDMENKVAHQRTYGALMDGTHMMLMCFDAGKEYTSWKLDLKELRGTFTHSRTYAMDLENLLNDKAEKSRDMVLGVQCLMRAFAPEVAGATLAQVVERVGTSSRTSASSCFRALEESLENMAQFAERRTWQRKRKWEEVEGTVLPEPKEKIQQQKDEVWDEDAEELQTGWDPRSAARIALEAKRDALKQETEEVETMLNTL